jgi:hypothetical protein
MMLDRVIEVVATNPEPFAALAAGLLGAAGHYRKTGNLPVGRVPFRAIRDVFAELREEWFGRPRPKGVPAIYTDADPETVDASLRDAHFEDTDFSYQYSGQVYDRRRPSGVMQHPEDGREVPTELHVRAFETADGGTLLLAHDEANRYEAPGAHLRETVFSWQRGRGMLTDVLSADGTEHRKITSERRAEIEVV